MTAQIIDGKAIAAEIREGLKGRAEAFEKKAGRKAGLAVVLVGSDPASQVYVRNKVKACESTGLYSEKHEMPADTSQADLLKKVDALNADNNIDGILVQFPLPGDLNEAETQEAINPAKDVDGLTPISVGHLWEGRPGLAPCTPSGCIELIKRTGTDMNGAHAVVIGRSNLVGKPVAQLLLRENCTVSICHSRTKDLGGVVSGADIVIAAVGRLRLITADMVKEGAVVIDVGMNSNEEGKLAGDVDFEGVKEKASFITPVPGGVGPMTIAMLLKNTLQAAEARHG